MSKGSSSQPTQQTVTQSSVPEKFYPYLQQIMDRSNASSEQPYQAYQDQRIAQFNPTQQESFDLTAQNTGSYQPFYDQATGSLGQAQNGIGQALGQLPSSQNLTHYQEAAPQQVSTQAWNSEQAQNYMNPYMSQVFSGLRSNMEDAYGKDQQSLNAQAQGAGAFGGSRFGVMSQTLKDDYERNLSSQEGQALSNAYSTGQQAFGNDQFRQLQGDISNQQAGLSSAGQNLSANLGVQQLGAQTDLQSAGLGLQGAGQYGSLASTYGNLGSSYNGLGQANAQALGQSGLQQQQQQQAGLDTAYSDFVNQNAYGQNQLNFLSGILHGVNMPMNSGQTTYNYTSPYSQMLGAGIGLSGLMKSGAGG